MSFILFFLLLIGPLVFIHELGHFLFAKLFGVKVLRFSLGFGPPIPGLRRKWGETEYQVATFPLGGYVKMLGEDPTETVAEEDRRRSFNGAALWKRYIIVAAGPVFNLLLPMVIIFFFLLSLDEAAPASVGTVIQGRPAAEAGLLPGDKILRVNGKRTKYWRDAVSIIESRPNQPTDFVILRQGQQRTLKITPALHETLTFLRVVRRVGRIGITLQHTRAQVGIIDRASPAYRGGLRTGDIVTRAGDRPIKSWHDLREALKQAGGKPLELAVLRQSRGVFGFVDLRELVPRQVTVAPAEADAGAKGWASYGIQSAEMFVDLVEPDTPAHKTGLRAGDQVLELDGKPIKSWLYVIEQLRNAPKKKHRLAWRTPEGKRLEQDFTLKEVNKTDEFKQEQKTYVFGAYNRIAVWSPDNLHVPFGERLTFALVQAPVRTYDFCAIIVVGVGQIMRGKISTKTIGGPIMLGYAAKKVAMHGWQAFIWFMALISINLALINLFPIPILDGGHILIFTIEAIRRKPISLATRNAMTSVGLVMIVLLMVLAFYNDCSRYVFG